MGGRPSGWALAGLGCGVPLILLGVVGALFLGGTHTARRGPEANANADLGHALEVLGVERLPDGYELLFLDSWPLFADAVALAGTPAPGSAGEASFFLYVQSWSNRIWDRLDERAVELTAAGRHRFSARLGGRRAGEWIALGGEDRARVDAYRGTYRIGDAAPVEGYVTVIRIDCHMDPRPRVAIWTSPFVGPGPPGEKATTGTVADPQQAAALFARLGICGPPAPASGP